MKKNIPGQGKGATAVLDRLQHRR
ncbi:uncharacterized protein G2W53_032824 [Senna tora]|uniref:Uncharacterized protein n=1 Tax=Senna tora TaxID=362788 RepID=A0A834W7Z8_9FABA|nr:uncharacterized protein G2W53_032824 [Senna tora]